MNKKYNLPKFLVLVLLCVYTLSIHHTIVAQTNPADIDSTFQHGGLSFPGSAIREIVVQPDGKILIAGSFSSYFNKSNIHSFARLNPDGTIDPTFNIGTGIAGFVNDIALQPDGKIVLAGHFSSYNGVASKNIVRLNSNGTIDNTFIVGAGFSDDVKTILLQADGKIVAGGLFITYNNIIRRNLARINSDGSFDEPFIPKTGPFTGPDQVVTALALQSDGKIIIGGGFSLYGAISRSRLARINIDGSLDVSFTAGNNLYQMDVIKVQQDGKIMIGGIFSNIGGVSRNGVARINANGSLDTGFNSGLLSSTVSPIYDIIIQPNGKYVIGGQFTSVAGVANNCIARLNNNGSLDASFDSGTGAWSNIYALALQPNGRIILGGYFPSFNNFPCPNLARLRGDTHFNTINGSVFNDLNSDCVKQPSEDGIPFVMVKSIPGNYYGMTNETGNYQLVVDSGDASYTISQEFNSVYSKLIKSNHCTSSYTLGLSGSSNDTCCFNFADTLLTCSILNVSIQNTRMRRCFRNNTYVKYNNYGNKEAQNAIIKIEYPPYIVPISSTPMWTARNGSILIYDMGTIEEGGNGRISIIDSVICGIEEIRGYTQCIKATISPVSDCITNNPSWDKSSIKVSGRCVGDSIHFAIVNGGSGNMQSNQSYRIYMNDTLIYLGNFMLQSGESFIVKCSGDRNTIRLEADQHPMHPGRSYPRATVEGCGSNGPVPVIPGLVTTAPQDDLEEEVASTCNIIRDSYDPNDKNVFPSGLGSDKQIAPGQELEYVVRFQNTGTDTAYTVRIIDTLDLALDPASFIQGASSHPYRLSITGKGQVVLNFVFKNINLPDSTTNLEKSNGLVSYRVTVPSSTALGTIIRNKAYIFFDYNSAIITNETVNTIGVVSVDKLSEGNRVAIGNLVPKPIVATTNPPSLCTPSTFDLTATVSNTSTPNLEYYYYSDSASSVFLSDPTNLNSSGIYSVVGVNAGAGTDTSYVSLTVHPKPIVVANPPAEVCTPALIDLTSNSIVSGSTSGLNYSYFNDAQATSQLLNPSEVSTSGVYYIVGVNNLTSCSDTSNLSVNINSKPSVLTNAPLPICAPGKIDLTNAAIVLGSTSGLSYMYYSNPEATSVISLPNSITTAGTYYLVGSSSKGCRDSASVNLVIHPKPNVIANTISPVCAPVSIDLTNPTIISNSTSGLMYSYFTNPQATSVVSDPTTMTASGDYYIVGIDGNNCADTTMTNIVISNPKIIVTNPDPVTNNTVDITNSAITNGSTNGLTYSYFLDDNITILTDPTEITQGGLYSIVGEDVYGCLDTALVEVIIQIVAGSTLGQTTYFNLYPNPTDDKINIQMSTIGSANEFRIYSSLGALLNTYQLSSIYYQELILEKYNQGIYFCELWQDGKRILSRTIEIR